MIIPGHCFGYEAVISGCFLAACLFGGSPDILNSL